MEFWRYRPHKSVEEVLRLANMGASFLVDECLLNDDLAQIPQDEAQRIVSLAHEVSLAYTLDQVVPIDDYGKQEKNIQIINQEEKLIKINFRTNGLKEAVRSIYNDANAKKRI